MGIFNIKLKTKNGNDIKKKETFTIFFRLNYKSGIKKTAEYTYRIMYSRGIDDPQRVLQLKNSNTVQSREDLTIKVMLNLCHILGQITKKHNIDPDFVNFISPDYGHSDAWKFLNAVFKRPGKGAMKAAIDPNHPFKWLEGFTNDYENVWTAEKCGKMKIRKDELDMLKAFADLNPNTYFMTIDPNHDPSKYAKSLVICSRLQDRIDRNHTQLQITDDPY